MQVPALPLTNLVTVLFFKWSCVHSSVLRHEEGKAWTPRDTDLALSKVGCGASLIR